jgi:hypothetical protein
MNPIKSLNINSINFVNYNINKNYTSNSINIKHNNSDIYIQSPLLDIDKFAFKIKLSIDNCKNDLERDLVNNFLNLDNFTKLYVEKLNNQSSINTHINYIPTINNNSEFNIKLNSNIKYFLNKNSIDFNDIFNHIDLINYFKFILKCRGLYFTDNICFLKWDIITIKFLTKKIIKKNIVKLDEEINNVLIKNKLNYINSSSKNIPNNQIDNKINNKSDSDSDEFIDF